MRIEELTMRAYGPLGNHRLSLAGGAEGLHVVFGPNEAGKSLCLRGIEYALFGLPAQLSPLGFDPALIRIGATLSRRLPSGQTERISYRRSRTQILRADRDTPFEDARLDEFLGDLTKDTFRATFGFNSDRIRQGAEELRDGGGDIARAVFAASSGIDQLQRIAERLREDATRMFVVGGNRTLNQGIQSLRDVHSAYRSAVMPPATARATVETLARERQRSAELTVAIKNLRLRRTHLIRVQQGLAPARSIRHGRQILAETANLPPLLDDFTVRLADAEAAVQKAAVALDSAHRSTRTARDEFEAITVDERYVVHYDEIAQLTRRADVVRNCLRDLPGKRNRAADLRDRILAALREIGRTDAADAPLNAVLGTPSQTLVTTLIDEHKTLTQRLEVAKDNLAAQQSAVDAIRRRLAEMGEIVDARPFSRRLQELQSRGDLGHHRLTLENQLQRARAEADAARARLTGLRTTDPAAEDRVVPSREEVSGFATRFTALDQRLADAHLTVHEAEGAVEALARRLQDLAQEDDLPATNVLPLQRQLRDDLLRDMRARVDDGTIAPPGTRELGDRLQAAVARADEIADIILSNVARIHERDRAVVDHREAVAALTRHREWLASVRGERDALSVTWRSRWDEIGIDAGSPAAMLSWLDTHAVLAKATTLASDRTTELGEINEQIACDLVSLRGLLGDLGVPAPAGETADRGSLLELAADAVSDLQKQAGRRHQQEENLREAVQLVAERVAARDRALESLGDWRARWSQCMTAIRQAVDVEPVLVQGMIEAMTQISALMNQLTPVEDDIGDMEAEVKAAEAQLLAILQALGRPSDASPLVDQITALSAAAVQQQQRFDARTAAKQRLDRRRDEETAAVQQQAEAAAEVTRLLELAHAETSNAAREVALRVAERRRAEVAVQDNEAQLARLAAVESLDEFVEECLLHDEQVLQQTFADLEAEEQRLDVDLKASEDVVRRLTQETAAYDSDRAARLMEDCLAIQARVVRDVEHYVPLRLASHVLERAIQRFREASASPIVTRASGFFQRMTGGAFEGIGQGDNAIYGLRDAATAVPIERMSEGTRDQVYLAMRLAALCESHGTDRDLMPLVIDDGLVNFDDDRTSRILELLAETSALTQIVIFTHHRHVVGAAEALRTRSPDRVFIHTIEPTPTSAAP